MDAYLEENMVPECRLTNKLLISTEFNWIEKHSWGFGLKTVSYAGGRREGMLNANSWTGLDQISHAYFLVSH
jgi:hypothetical protein